MSNKVNYCIAHWRGSRRLDNSHGFKHPIDCLESHLNILSALKHSLSQVSIIVAENKPDDEEITKDITARFDLGCPIKVSSRENRGLSFGSFQYAYDLYGSEFSHYIFMEDDYAPCLDYFDQILTNDINTRQGCGYLCQLSTQIGMVAITNGIAISIALDKIAQLGLKMYDGDVSTLYPVFDQIAFGNAFKRVGYSIQDFSNKYKSEFLTHNGYVVEYGQAEETLIKPIQLLK